MPRIRDLRDAALREEMQSLESRIDEGEYGEVVRGCAAIYVRIITEHPDLISNPPAIEALSTVGGQFFAPVQFRTWPELVGVELGEDDAGKPTMVYAKESFNLSETLTCFEYLLEAAVHAQTLGRDQ